MVTVKQAIIKTLQERGEPMRLGEITQSVLTKTDRLRGKTPKMTVNAILSTDERFKRVAKGTYALEEWRQYRRLRQVKEIACEVLSQSGQPLPLSKIVEAVLAERSLKGAPKATTRSLLRHDSRFRELERDVFGLTEWN